MDVFKEVDGAYYLSCRLCKHTHTHTHIHTQTLISYLVLLTLNS